MHFLLDVHLPIKLSKVLVNLGFNSTHVNLILDKWYTKDAQISAYADLNEMILVTKDQDFRNSFLLSHKPKRLIKINLGNISKQELDLISKLYQGKEPFMLEVGLDIVTVIR